jgi:hypothetical protein
MEDEDYVQLAIDYLGTAIRDNSKEEKIQIGKLINEGLWEGEDEQSRD